MDKEIPTTGQIELFEKLTTELCKYEILKDELLKKKKKSPAQLATYKAYKDIIAKNLGLADAEAVHVELQNLKRYVDYKMRRYVRLSIINGVSVQDAFNYAPDWFKQLDKPLNLLQRACQVERMNSLKYYRAGRTMNNFLWELLKGARSAAVRELSNSPEQALRALTSKDAVRGYAETIDMEVTTMHGIWVRFYGQSVYKLMALIEVGDCSDNLSSRERLTLQEWQAADMGLLYDIRLRVVNTKYFKSSLTVCPMILLFKLMIGANEKINKNYSTNAKSHTSHVGCQKENGAQTGTEDLAESHNNKEANVTPSCSNVTENIVPEVHPQSINKQSKENNSGNKSKTDKKGPNEYETAEIWALVHSNYTNRGRSASAPLLQKRWHELKQQTRAQIWAPGQQTPVPILLALAKRFPYILTEKLPTWSELVKNNQVFLDLDLESYKTEYPQAHLDIPTDMCEEILFDELYDWSDDEIEIINENKETITVSDSDDEQTTKPDSNNEKDTDTSELNVVDNNCIEQLERIDPTTAKVKIIFEDDSDSDINDYLHGDDTSNLQIVDVPESANDKNEKTPPCKKESDVINSDNNDSTNECSKTLFPLNFQRTNDVNSDVKTEIKEEITVVSSEVQEENRQSEIEKLIQNIEEEADDKLKCLYNTLPPIEPNLQCNDGLNNVRIECVEHLNDIKSESDIENDDITDINKSNTDIVNNSERSQSSFINDSDIFNDDNESLDSLKKYEIKDNLSDKDPLSTPLVDEKLIKLSHVILTPIEHLCEWQCYSRDGVINCRRFSVRNFSKQVVVTSKQLRACRPYIRPESSRNGISAHKNREIHQMPNNLRRKRKFLTEHLKLSRTYFSLEFWNDRNIEQLELCKPLSVKLNRSTRVVKRIELADIDEVRRINRTILTAQVAPITVGTNHTIVNDPVPSEADPMTSDPLISVKDNTTNVNQISRTSFKCSIPNVYKIQTVNQPELTSKVVPNPNDNETVDSLVRSDDSPLIPNLFENEFTENSELNYETDNVNIEDNKLQNEDEVKDLVKKIVRRGVLPKLPGRTCLVETRSNLTFTEKQKELEKDIRKISEIFMQRYDRLNKTKPPKQKYKTKKKREFEVPPPLLINPNLNSLEEWQRQKVQNLQYFNFEPVPDKTKPNETKSMKKIKEHTNKKSNDTKDKESKKIPGENETYKEIDDNKNIKFNTDNLANVINNDSTTIKCENIDISSENSNEKDNNNINNGLKRKSVDTTDILSKQSRIESNEDEKLINAPITEPDSVIDLCDDSDDNEDVKPPLTTNNPHSINQSTQNINESLNSNKPQINIKIVQNTIEINGQCTSGVLDNQNKELLTFLSKVAAKIQEKNMAPSVPTPNPVSNNVYYVIKTFDKNIQNPITPESGVNNINVGTSNLNPNTVPNVPVAPNPSPMFYVVKIPDGISGATSVVTPEQFAPMPVIQSVTSLSQMHQQNFPLPNLPGPNQYNIPIVNALEKKSDAMPATATARPRKEGGKGKSNVTLSRMNDTQICTMGVSSGSSHQISDEAIKEDRLGNYGPNKGQKEKDMSSLLRKFGSFQNLQQTWNLSIEKNNITVTPNSSQDTSRNNQQNIISNYSYNKIKKSSKYINDSFS